MFMGGSITGATASRACNQTNVTKISIWRACDGGMNCLWLIGGISAAAKTLAPQTLCAALLRSLASLKQNGQQQLRAHGEPAPAASATAAPNA